MDTDSRFLTPATRRTIVATGAKLAYAAPLVAASLKLSALNVAATHSPGHVICSERGCIRACDADPAALCAGPCEEGQCGVFDPIGQPCCNPGYCDPANWVIEYDGADPVSAEYIGPREGCPPTTRKSRKA